MNDSTHYGTEVPIAQIDRRLTQFWATEKALTKASLINFAVYSEESGSLSKNSELIQQLTREHSCRALLVERNPNSIETTTRAWINAHCHLSGSQTAVCSEQIAFLLSGREVGRFQNVIFSHVESDLPLILWWQGELSEAFSNEIAREIDRLIFDSSNWSRPAQSLNELISVCKKIQKPLILQDLEWTRSYAFRLAIASLFNEPTALSWLDSINRIEICHHPNHRTAALLLLAWFQTQTKWQPREDWFSQSNSKDHIPFQLINGREFDAYLASSNLDDPLEKIVLETSSGRIEVSINEQANHLRLLMQGGGIELDQLAPAPPTTTLGLLHDQLSRGGKNALYRNVIPQFLALSHSLDRE